MTTILTEIALLIALLLANGLFAMAEIALVSSRKSRLQALAADGRGGAKSALGLMEQPGVFLSTVQVGITLVGTLAGASSGAYLIGELKPVVAALPYVGHLAEGISTLVVVSAITYLSVVIGELVPKRLAIAAPETCASRLSPSMTLLAKIASPLVRLLDGSSELLARLFGVRGGQEQDVSEEDVRAMLHQGTLAGVFKKSERSMVEGVLNLDDLTAADLMTPKNQIVWINLDDPDAENRRKMAASGHSHFPAYRKMRDNVAGMISVKTLWTKIASGEEAPLTSLVQPAMFVPETAPCMKVIEEFRQHARHQAMVVDEFGSVAGLVTLNDMMEAIVGHLPDRAQRPQAGARRQGDGTWIVDAMMDVDDFVQATGISLDLVEEEDGDYRTLGGLVLHQLGRVPSEGDAFEFNGHRFEVIDMDGHRVDKVMARRIAPASPPEASA